MVKNHLKRIVAPKTWAISRKKTTFVVRPRGYLMKGLPVSLILTELLELCSTRKEVKQVVQAGKVLIDGRVIKDERRPVVSMSVISIEGVGSYRVLLNTKGKLYLQKVSLKNSDKKLCKVISKKIVKSNKIHLGFHDGTCVLTDKKGICVNDTLVFKVPNLEVLSHLKFEKGAKIYLVSGSHVGRTGTLEKLSPKVVIRIDDKSAETEKKSVFVIDDVVMDEK